MVPSFCLTFRHFFINSPLGYAKSTTKHKRIIEDTYFRRIQHYKVGLNFTTENNIKIRYYNQKLFQKQGMLQDQMKSENG